MTPPTHAGNGAGSGDRVVCRYDYRDETGTLLYQVERREPKRFLQRRPDGQGGWIWKMEGVRRVLYRLPDLLARAGETVWIAEGEKDADALAALGLLATTNAGGAGKWRPEYTETLRGREVVILPDKDAPGREHAAKVKEALAGAAVAVHVLELPGAGKDAADWLAAGGTKEELGRLLAAATRSEGEAPIFEEIGADELDGLQFPDVYWPVPGIIPEGASILAAPPKSGKSTLLLSICAALTTGGRALGKIKVERCRVLYFSLEEPPRLTQSRLRTMLGRGRLPTHLRIVYQAMPLAELSDAVEQYMARYPDTKVIVIDTLAHARGASPRARKDITQEDYQELVPFSHLAQRLHIAIIIVAHTRKGESTDEMEMVSGSYGVSGAVDSIIVLQRKRHESDATLAVFSRELGSEQKYALRWDALTLTYVLEGTVAEVQGTREQEEVIELLEAAGKPVATRQVAQALQVTDAAASARLRRYVDAGIIASAGYGKYTTAGTAKRESGVEVLKSGVKGGVEVGVDVEVAVEVRQNTGPPSHFNSDFNTKTEFNTPVQEEINTSTPRARARVQDPSPSEREREREREREEEEWKEF